MHQAPQVRFVAGDAVLLHAQHAVEAARRDEDESLRSKTDWVLVSRDAGALKRPGMSGDEAPDRADWRTWTDDYSNLIQILK